MAGESAAERHSRGVTAYEKRLRALFDELVDGTAHLKDAERMGAIDEIVRSLFLANVDVFTAADADMFEEMTGLQAAMPATEDMAKKADALVNIVRSRVWKQVYEGDESFRDAAFGPIQRNLRDGGRNLAIRSAEKHGILWARVPKGKTCAWCQMVASQGFVYSSEEAAGKASKFHENCDCMIVPDTAEGHKAVKRLGFDIKAARRDYEAAAKAMRADGSRPKGRDADWYMRRLQPGKYTDGVASAEGIGDFVKDTKVKVEDYRLKRLLNRMPTASGGRMDIREALRGTNPGWESGALKYRMNCQRCVVAYEARRRGYEVVAKPARLKKNGKFAMTEKLPEHPLSAWRDAQPLRVKGTGKDDIVELLEKWGDGARAEVRVTWRPENEDFDWSNPEHLKKLEGHVFVAENVSGSVLFLDPQNGSSRVSYYFDKVIIDSTSVARIDNLEFSPRAQECFEAAPRKKERDA